MPLKEIYYVANLKKMGVLNVVMPLILLKKALFASRSKIFIIITGRWNGWQHKYCNLPFRVG
ncbi:uncharacterized protein Dvar_31990 [Desulfosarcina variabilis str. Montpellier]